MSHLNANENWPPRSPHDALLSTPSGRHQLRRLAERASPSPSPIRRSKSTASIRNNGKGLMIGGTSSQDAAEEDDDDEETLQLQLQEIQARLKLKKLQKKTKQSSDDDQDYVRAGSVPLSRANSVATSRAQSRLADIREERLQKSRSQNHINVPVSPIRRTQTTEPARSPGRVLLGIDKGLKGSDISLRRAPSLRNPQEGSNSASKTLSFSERMAAMRARDAEREERDLRIKRIRSTAFDIDPEKLQQYKEVAVELPPAPRPAPEFSRDEVLRAFNKPSSSVPQSRTAPNLLSTNRGSSNAAESSNSFNKDDSHASFDTKNLKRKSSKAVLKPNEVTESDASQFEPYSSIHLSKRVLPHKELTRILTGKKTFSIPDLLRIVKGPDFCGPDIEEDVVVFAVIASKSDPKTHAKNDKGGKFMVLNLTDLKWELDLFLFGSAFDKFWKLSLGTIIAILNPGIMAPQRGREATGKFSLTLNSDADTILEVGSARDLGFCKSIKKDGKSCDTWIDKRHTEFCDFHVNLTLEKTHAKRMEVNTMTFGKGRGYGERKTNSRDMTGHFDRLKKTKEEAKTRYDRESHSQIYIGKRSTVNMLDDVDFDPDAFHRGSTKEERVNRNILAQEKERELARKLGVLGGGLGADYMRKRAPSRIEQLHSNDSPVETQPPDAAALGLLSTKSRDIHLSPIKRKRANTLSSTAAVGWGGNLTKELGRMKNGESLQPVKKKTRFVTDKGIREAGRESFGGEAVKAAIDDLDDDDDDLDIVRE